MIEITLKVNGKNVNTSANILLPNLLAELGLNPRLIAIEYNGEILHRQFWEHTQLQQGDNIEVVTIVGGG